MSQYHLKISDTYDLLIGGAYKLFIDAISTSTGISAAKRWNGTEWVLIYEFSFFDGAQWLRPRRIKYFNGTAWVNASLK